MPRNLRAYFALSLTAVLLGWAPARSAAGVSSNRLIEGPVLVGSDVMWLEPSRAGGLRIRRSRRAADSPRSLAHLFSPWGLAEGEIVGSDSGYAVVYQAITGRNERDPGTPLFDEVVVGPPGGSPQTAARCDLTHPITPSPKPSADMSQEALAYAIRPCDGAPRAVEVQPLPRGSAPTRRIPTDFPARVRTAGSFVAWANRPASDPTGLEILVYDWRTGVFQGRLDEKDVPGGIAQFDLGPDGTVAFVHGVRRHRVGIWRAGATGPRTTRLPARSAYILRFAGPDRLVFKRGIAGQRYALAAELGVYDVRRERARSLERDLVFRLAGDHFDFDGQRLAWEAPTCFGSELRYAAHLPRRAAPVRRQRCRLRLLRPVRLTRSRVRVRFACSGYVVESCPSQVVLTHAPRGDAPGGGEVLGRRRSRDFSALGGLALVRLNRRGQAVVRRARGVLRVRITATTEDARGRVERRSVVRTVRRG